MKIKKFENSIHSSQCVVFTPIYPSRDQSSPPCVSARRWLGVDGVGARQHSIDSIHEITVYTGVTVNPSATLAPINTADSWDIREKPAGTAPPLPVEPLSPDTNEPTPAPSFWSRLGNKFTNTFDKAKEKARNIFG